VTRLTRWHCISLNHSTYLLPNSDEKSKQSDQLISRVQY